MWWHGGDLPVEAATTNGEARRSMVLMETDAVTCGDQVDDATRQAVPAPSSMPLTSGPF
jgi:hypothetical protein